MSYPFLIPETPTRQGFEQKQIVGDFGLSACNVFPRSKYYNILIFLGW